MGLNSNTRFGHLCLPGEHLMVHTVFIFRMSENLLEDALLTDLGFAY